MNVGCSLMVLAPFQDAITLELGEALEIARFRQAHPTRMVQYSKDHVAHSFWALGGAFKAVKPLFGAFRAFRA
jgi:hypothetical protein